MNQKRVITVVLFSVSFVPMRVVKIVESRTREVCRTETAAAGRPAETKICVVRLLYSDYSIFLAVDRERDGETETQYGRLCSCWSDGFTRVRSRDR